MGPGPGPGAGELLATAVMVSYVGRPRRGREDGAAEIQGLREIGWEKVRWRRRRKVAAWKTGGRLEVRALNAEAVCR